MKMQTKLGLGVMAVVAAGVFLMSCTDGTPIGPNPGGGGGGNGGGTGGGTGIALSVSVVQNISSAAQQDVVLNWMPGPDDGYGALDGFRATATDSIAQTDTNYVAEPGRTTTFTFGPWAINTTVSGAACVRAERRAQSSAYVCTGWSASVDDQAPPTPIIDSVRAISLHDSLSVTAYYRLSPDDGGGAYTMSVYAKDDHVPMIDSASVDVPTAAGSQAVILVGPYTYNQTYTGQACVTATRRALFSQACASFTGLIVDPPPPPPILSVIDSVGVLPATVALTSANTTCLALPDSQRADANGYAVPDCQGSVEQFCAIWYKSDGKAYLQQGQGTLGKCQNAYDSLPASVQLPGYPTASVRLVRDGDKFVWRENTRTEELAAVMFASPFRSTALAYTPWGPRT